MRSSRRHGRGARYERYRGPGSDDPGPAGGPSGGTRPDDAREPPHRGEPHRSHHRRSVEPDPRRMYRDRRRGVLTGVCAGVADYFGFSLTGTRIATVIAALPLFPWVIGGYVVLALVLPPRPEEPMYRDSDEEAFWRSVRKSPISTLSQVRHKFRELEVKTQRLERYVTSKHFRLDRDFRDLER